MLPNIHPAMKPIVEYIDKLSMFFMQRNVWVICLTKNRKVENIAYSVDQYWDDIVSILYSLGYIHLTKEDASIQVDIIMKWWETF